jgi:RNA polymerase sigma-70 factor (ECF subfamily)
MPPLPQWLQGATEIGASLAGMVLMPGSSGTIRLEPAWANALPAFAAYKRDEASGQYHASAIQLVEVDGDRIASIVAFLDPSLFGVFGLPDALAAR